MMSSSNTIVLLVVVLVLLISCAVSSVEARRQVARQAGNTGSFADSRTRQQTVPLNNLLKSLERLSKEASKNLSALFQNATQRLYYQKKYQCSLTPPNARSDDCRRPADPSRPDRAPLYAYLEKINGAQVVQELTSELEQKMKQKTEAVTRSVKAAEQAYVDYKPEIVKKAITYFNAKRINRKMTDKYYESDNNYRNFVLRYDTHFKADVNKTNSVVHVPTNVFDGSIEINNGARWTQRLNDIFRENMDTDNSIYWQYFGSSLGFYRVFPGSKWATSDDKIDMFDCRTKGWYIQASCSPKDLVILLDVSGSMLGLRFRIAMNTVDQILKTLGEDDFFNIIKFSSKIRYVDQCFNRTLIQATAENTERLKKKIRGIKIGGMANFEDALIEAFELFNKTASDAVGSLCNRAIMLITDGASDTYENVFRKYNGANRTETGMTQVRVFSFLIGQDASFNREIHWMACKNKGYYVEIKTIAAVQDNMKQYVTTLARPLALANFNDAKWTGVYIDEAAYSYDNIKLHQFHNAYYFDFEAFNKMLFLRYYPNAESFEIESQWEHGKHDEGEEDDDDEEEDDATGGGGHAEYEYASRKTAVRSNRKKKKKKLVKSSMPDMRLMASVAAAVFDKKPESSKQGLLGVIGTDLPIHFFKTSVPPPKLGVNAYTFAVNHNGFVLFHPDYVPPFEAPDFTSVDVARLESKFLPWEWYKKMRTAYFGPIPGFLPNGTETLIEVPRNDSKAAMARLIELLNKVNSSVPDYKSDMRMSMVKSQTGKSWMMSLKTADSYSRPKVIGMHYFYTKIPYTPFTLGLAIPGGKTHTYDYGFVHMDGKVKITDVDMSVLAAREGLHTKIPSQWNYCTLTAEELEVGDNDYKKQLKEMYHEFEENYNATVSDVPPDVLDGLDPSWPPEFVCKALVEKVNESIYVVNGTINMYNETIIDMHNSTFPAIERFTYTTDNNETKRYFQVNVTQCLEMVQQQHIRQLEQDMKAWMFEKKFQETLETYIRKLKEKPASADDKDDKKCDMPTIENLMFDAEITNDTINRLFDGVLHYHALYGIKMIFVATRSGLTRYVTPDHSESDFINTHPETILETYYERAVEAGHDVITVSLDNTSQFPKQLILAQAMFVSHATRTGNVGTAAVAVSGIEMPAKNLSDLLFTQPCDDSLRPCTSQCTNKTVCYLLDDNGYIMAAENETMIGLSLADTDPNLFIQLTNFDEIIDDSPDAKQGMPMWEEGVTIWQNLYEMIIVDDTQAICSIYAPKASALRLLNPFTVFFQMVNAVSVQVITLLQYSASMLYTNLIIASNLLHDIGTFASTSITIPEECRNAEMEMTGSLNMQALNCTADAKISKGDQDVGRKKKTKFLGKKVCTKRYNIYRLNAKATKLNGQLTENCRDCSGCRSVGSDDCRGCTGYINGTKYRNLTWAYLSNCSRAWRARIVPKTNLVMLVVDKLCVCKRDSDIVQILANKTLDYTTVEPDPEVKDKDDFKEQERVDLDEECLMLRIPRSRHAPDKCASDSPHENVTECSPATTVQTNHFGHMLLLPPILIHFVISSLVLS